MIDIELQRTRSAMAESVTLPIATWLEVLDELETLRQVEPVKQEPVMVTPGGGAFPFVEVGYVGEFVAPTESLPAGTPLYAAPVRTKDLTDVADLQDAVTKALKKAFHLGQTYWQQADSESYAANKRADVTQELYWKLEDDTRAVIAADREKNK